MKLNHILPLNILSIALVFVSCMQNANEENTGNEKDQKEMKNEETNLSGKMSIDTEQSTIEWNGVMLGIKEHRGTLDFQEGNITIKDGKLTGGKLVADMSTITPTDNNFDKENPREKLVGHLKSADFFDVGNHPTSVYTITGQEGSTVTGTLSIRGNKGTEKVENVKITEENGKVKITGNMTFNRKEYDVAFEMGIEDMVISDDVSANFEIIATKGN